MASAAKSFFDKAFSVLTGHAPFPWQEKLYNDWLLQGKIPSSCNLPTGLGKTNVIAVWLIALANGANLPRRLVYVVNRRTVVDQTTSEVERVRRNLEAAGIADSLRRLFSLNDDESPLAISTLRGQFADNREWSTDPSRPAIICGTVDMIGSRLLFSGYGVGFKSRPLHAGFLGQDALLVHDEAHLEPAFQKLVTDIEKEQTRERERGCDLPWSKLHVMQLTATTRDGGQQADDLFELTDKEKNPPKELPEPPTNPIDHIWRRLKAKKQLRLKRADDDGKIAEEIAERALQFRKDDQGTDTKAAVLIFVRTLDDVKRVYVRLTNKKDGVPKDHIQQLTGTMRGLERDQLVNHWIMRCFSRQACPLQTIYLVCTSAGEVGIDISADHLVCDLSTFESMAQRFGRVNRYGDGNARIDVVYPAEFDEKDKLRDAREATLRLLQELNGDASPLNLGRLDPNERAAAFTPKPTILQATDILFDAWAMTSIHQKMPGRPPVEPYLHGIAEWQPPETYVAWREEVEVITDELLEQYSPADLLNDYPPKPHELLRDRSDRVFKHLEMLAKRHADEPVWIMDSHEAVKVTTLAKLADKRWKDRINGCTILLPPSVGGLADGMLDGASEHADDVADISDGPDQRVRIHPDDSDRTTKTAKAADMRRVRSIELDTDDGEDDGPRLWDWYESIPLEGGRTAKKPVRLDTHAEDVENLARQIVKGLSLPDKLANVVVLAARLHDSGKQRDRFQITLGNRDYPNLLLAKSGRKGARLPEPFRHEFASVLDAQTDVEFNKLDDEMKGLVLHLIAAHHGRARPHFDLDQAFDPDRPSGTEPLLMETPRRFARLQRKYGRWGLAYLESLLRAADWAASAEPSQFVTETEEVSL
ncbi:MAG: type I-U CRISPR-associated helicase/endonuclease Cas3 [Phycisphaerales bacterium]